MTVLAPVAQAQAQELPPPGEYEPETPEVEKPVERTADSGGALEGNRSVGIPKTEWTPPQAARGSVGLEEKGKKRALPGTSVAVAAAVDGDQGRQVDVEVFDQDVATRLGAAGFVLRVNAAASNRRDLSPSGASVPVDVTVNYASLAGRFGAGFADRLRVVALPACAVEKPVPKSCDVREVDLQVVNNRAASELSVKVVPTELGIRNEAPVDTLPIDEPATDATVDPEATTSTTIAPDQTTTTTAPESTTSEATATEGGDALEAQAAGAATPFAAGDGGVVMMMTSGTSGQEGSFAATQTSQAGAWSVGIGSGSFDWSYPVSMYPGPAGDKPELDLSYSSAAIDGMTGGENNQSSSIGLGWDHTTAYVERTYKDCSADGMASNVDDLCWYSDNAVLHLNGKTSRLVPTATANEFRLKDDPNWRVQRKYDGKNGDNDKEYWRVTDPSGTIYIFGRGATFEDASEPTQSAWTVPVLHAAGEGGCTNGYGRCDQAWRWNLDRVADTKGNITSFIYLAETNNYGGLAGTAAWGYTRGGRLLEIRWGIRNQVNGSGQVRTKFEAAYRCNTLSETCGAPTPSNGTSFPDVPNDLICTGTPCSKKAPTFFGTKRVFRISSQIYVPETSSWREVDATRLDHEWVNNTEGQQALWLRYLRRSGYSEATGLTHPVMKFQAQNSTSSNLLPNRVDNNPSAGVQELKQFRLGAIYTDTGSRIEITYGQPDPCPATSQWPGKPGATFTWDQNQWDCFPKWFTPDGGTLGLGGFHKYVVTKVEEFDLVGGSDRQATSYTYEDDPAWHYDDNPVYSAGSGNRTWNEFRGYSRVTTDTGAGGATQTTTQHRVFRGMHGDRTAGGGSKTVNLATYSGASYQDTSWKQSRPSRSATSTAAPASPPACTSIRPRTRARRARPRTAYTRAAGSTAGLSHRPAPCTSSPRPASMERPAWSRASPRTDGTTQTSTTATIAAPIRPTPPAPAAGDSPSRRPAMSAPAPARSTASPTTSGGTTAPPPVWHRQARLC